MRNHLSNLLINPFYWWLLCGVVIVAMVTGYFILVSIGIATPILFRILIEYESIFPIAA